MTEADPRSPTQRAGLGPVSRPSARRRRLERGVQLGIFGLAALLYVAVLGRQTLSADELFSLAMATGHSLEHPAAWADERLGDWIEAPGALPAQRYRRYLSHDDPAAGVARVIRAVRLSDTSPPLYYVLLHGWTRALGTGDLALRLLSAFSALATFPLLMHLARRAGGRPAVLPACVLFAVSPAAVLYATEVRMYALVCLLAAALLVLTLAVPGRRANAAPWLLWTAIGVAGLLTHYFFVFVWGACAAWLVADRARWRRPGLWLAILGTVAIVAPWYMTVPASLDQWRVTKGWLDGPLGRRQALFGPLSLAWGLLSGHSTSDDTGRVRWLVTIVLIVAAVALWRRVSWRAFKGRRSLLWLSLLAAALGLLAFDLVLGTKASTISRYALAGLPAGLALTAMALGRVHPFARLTLLGLIVLAALPADWTLATSASRHAHPFRQIAAEIRDAGNSAEVVALVHSVPSGVLGVSRYADPEARIASWVGQLGQRHVPESVKRLTAGASTVVFVRVHAVGAPAPEEEWLRSHSAVLGEKQVERAHLVLFRAPPGGF